MHKGEFLCVIGDVGSGKSSLLNACIGDMIYVPEEEIKAFGGLDKEGDQDTFNDLKRRILSPDYDFTASGAELPIKLSGSISYVEQNSWI